MASELLMNKGDYRELGPNWVSRFLSRHSKLRSRFSQPLDRDRAETHDPKKLMRWFQLVESTIQKYSIQQKDVYNMDEKGFAIGAAERSRVVCHKSNLQIYKTQDGNREWVSLIECISADERLLGLFIIFKGKRQMKAWYDVLKDEDSYIALSEND